MICLDVSSDHSVSGGKHFDSYPVGKDHAQIDNSDETWRLDLADYGSDLGSFTSQETSFCTGNWWEAEPYIVPQLRRILNMMYTGEEASIGIPAEAGVVISGGFQQYLIRNRDKLRVETEQPRKGNGSSSTTFHDLPDSLQLHIFSFIKAADLCRIASVCRHWLMLSSDDLLWKRQLQCDVKTWHVIGHSSNPMVYEECQSEWCYKDIYLRCSPEVNRLVRQQNLNFHQLSSLLRSLWPKKTPRFAMFGPGLESATSGLTRKIIETKTGIFDVTGMFPGQFGGVGSGFTIKILSSGLFFNLMTLYMSTAHERQNLPREERLRNNRLLVARPGDEVIEGVEPHYELQQSVMSLCRTLDGLVFIVDASQPEETIAASRPELMAMVSELWSSPDVPVIVLSCVKEYTVTRVPCITIVESLQLGKLNRPWQVHDCVVDSLAGVQQALQWLVEQSHRR